MAPSLADRVEQIRRRASERYCSVVHHARVRECVHCDELVQAQLQEAKLELCVFDGDDAPGVVRALAEQSCIWSDRDTTCAEKQVKLPCSRCAALRRVEEILDG